MRAGYSESSRVAATPPWTMPAPARRLYLRKPRPRPVELRRNRCRPRDTAGERRRARRTGAHCRQRSSGRCAGAGWPGRSRPSAIAIPAAARAGSTHRRVTSLMPRVTSRRSSSVPSAALRARSSITRAMRSCISNTSSTTPSNVSPHSWESLSESISRAASAAGHQRRRFPRAGSVRRASRAMAPASLPEPLNVAEDVRETMTRTGR